MTTSKKPCHPKCLEFALVTPGGSCAQLLALQQGLMQRGHVSTVHELATKGFDMEHVDLCLLWLPDLGTAEKTNATLMAAFEAATRLPIERLVLAGAYCRDHAKALIWNTGARVVLRDDSPSVQVLEALAQKFWEERQNPDDFVLHEALIAEPLFKGLTLRKPDCTVVQC